MQLQENYFGYNHYMLSTRIEGKHERAEHIHHFLELLCVIDGEIEVIVNGKSTMAKKGDMAVISPFQSHGYSAKNYCKIWVSVASIAWVSELLGESVFLCCPQNVFTPSRTTFAYIEEKLPKESLIKREVSITEDFYKRAKALYYAILEEYFSCITANEKKLNTNALSATYKYIYEHYREKLTLKKVASAIGYTSNYISSCLSVIPNANFRTVLNSARIEHAKKLLVSTDMRVIDIALECGFSSENVFYGIFEKFTRQTPRKYRLSKKAQSR